MTSEIQTGIPPGDGRTVQFRRLEVKYLIDRTRRTALASDISALMRRDNHASGDGTYMVRSLYFDSPDYRAYHEKLNGVAIRHKLRVRAYGEDPQQAAFVRLEVKSRYLNFIHKIALDIPREDYCAVEQALRRRVLPPVHLLASNNISKEFFRLQRQYNLEPKIVIQYRRQAFERLEISRTRVNFDDELWATRHLDLLGPLRGARRVLQCGHGIFEIKVDGSMPFWLHALIVKYELQDQALSKFCYAVRSEARSSAIGRVDDLTPFPSPQADWDSRWEPSYLTGFGRIEG